MLDLTTDTRSRMDSLLGAAFDGDYGLSTPPSLGTDFASVAGAPSVGMTMDRGFTFGL